MRFSHVTLRHVDLCCRTGPSTSRNGQQPMTADHAPAQPGELREVEETSRLLLKNSAERVEIIDGDGRLVDRNAVSRRSIGTEQAPLGMVWEELWSESSRCAVRAALQRASEGLEAECEAQSSTPSLGARRWQLRVVPLRDRRGRPVRLVAVSRDSEADLLHEDSVAIEKQESSKPLRLSEERLRLAITGAALGTWHWDFLTGKQWWSDLTFAMFHLPPRPETTYDDFKAALVPSDRKRVDEALTRAIREHTDYESEYRVIGPDQSVHWIAGRARAYYDEHGTPLRMEGVVQDITARKNTEQALRASEQRYRLLADAMPHLVFQLGRDGTVIYANQHWKDYLGRTSLQPSEWRDVVHPDDFPGLMAAWVELDHAIDDRDVAPFRLRRHDGQYQWFACRSVVLRESTEARQGCDR